MMHLVLVLLNVVADMYHFLSNLPLLSRPYHACCFSLQCNALDPELRTIGSLGSPAHPPAHSSATVRKQKKGMGPCKAPTWGCRSNVGGYPGIPGGHANPPPHGWKKALPLASKAFSSPPADTMKY